MKDFLLITPPFTQLNTPYPATAYLKGFLNTKGWGAFQMDLGIEVILELFTADRLRAMFDEAWEKDVIQSENALRIFTLREDYIRSIEPVIHFLQGKRDHTTLTVVTLLLQELSDSFKSPLISTLTVCD